MSLVTAYFHVYMAGLTRVELIADNHIVASSDMPGRVAFSSASDAHHSNNHRLSEPLPGRGAVCHDVSRELNV